MIVDFEAASLLASISSAVNPTAPGRPGGG
jgi:hypothetical protein